MYCSSWPQKPAQERKEAGRLQQNAETLLGNIHSENHHRTSALFLDTPELCHYVWKNWGGKQGYHRTPLSLAVCHDDDWLVRFLVENTDCDLTFAEVRMTCTL